jgi:cytochrome c biogenesis protein CcmG/thiol:disulfide interchange protein DsbE
METGLTVSMVFLWLVVLFNLLLTLALTRRANIAGTSSLLTGLKKGQAAPEFTAQTLNGESMTLKDYRRPTVFVFISTHCGPCQRLLPELERISPQAAQSGVDLILVSGDQFEEAQDYVREKQIHLPVLVAPRDNNAFFNDYRITATPSYCSIDSQGMVQAAGYPDSQHGEWKALCDSWARKAIPV